MNFRKLRIAWSAGCGVACVLLLLLWARSYWWADVIGRTTSVRTSVVSEAGVIRIAVFKLDTSELPTWQWNIIAINDKMPAQIRTWEFRVGNEVFLRFPHRLPIAVAALVAAAPWYRWRFSLRMLLITTTLVALALGLVVSLR